MQTTLIVSFLVGGCLVHSKFLDKKTSLSSSNTIGHPENSRPQLDNSSRPSPLLVHYLLAKRKYGAPIPRETRLSDDLAKQPEQQVKPDVNPDVKPQQPKLGKPVKYFSDAEKLVGDAKKAVDHESLATKFRLEHGLSASAEDSLYARAKAEAKRLERSQAEAKGKQLEPAEPTQNVEGEPESLADRFKHDPKALHPAVDNGEDVWKIPKVIHHTYKEDLTLPGAAFPSLIWKTSFHSWNMVFPAAEFEHKFWLDAQLEQCLLEEFPDYVKAITEENRTKKREESANIELADAGRYCILWKYGGIYADLDYEVLKNFYEELKPGVVSLIESPYVENPVTRIQVQNSLMASPARHPLWREVFSYMSRPYSHAWNDAHGTGPRMLSRMADKFPPYVQLLPCTRFQRVQADDVGKNVKVRHDKKCGDPENVDLEVGIHWNGMSYSLGGFGGFRIGVHTTDWRRVVFYRLHPWMRGHDIVEDNVKRKKEKKHHLIVSSPKQKKHHLLMKSHTKK